MEQSVSTASASRLTPPGYRPRAVDARLDALMRAFGAVEIVGPKWCGKTWTALAHAASLTELDRPSEREAAQVDPNLALLGAAPHLVDEWQEVPEVWDASRRFIDDAAGRTGLLLLTGSVALSPRQRERVHHSGAGRIARIMMRPFSLHETGLSDGTVSLLDLFEGKGFAPFRCEVSLSDIAEWCCRGGWPAALALDAADACEVPANYVQAMLDVNVAEEGMNPATAEGVLRALAMNASRAVTYNTLLADMESVHGATTSVNTLTSYLDMLERQYVCEPLSGWAPPLRAKQRVRTKPKRYFVDPSLAAALLGATPEALLHDMQTLGDLFENLCLRDLRVCLSAQGGLGNKVSYYRDEKGLEVDFVVEHGGSWAGVEAKLSDAKVDEAAHNLLRLRDKVTGNPAARNAEPAFLAVVVGASTLAYQRKDGVYVIPLAALGA